MTTVNYYTRAQRKMKKRYIFQLILLLVIINYTLIPVNVSAVDYRLEINENDAFIWEIDEVDSDKYEVIFVTEPDFDKDDQKKIVITNIEETDNKWRVTYDLWDYTDDTDDFSEAADDEKTKKVYKDPEDQADSIIDLETFARMWVVPNPSNSYIEKFREEHSNDFFDVFVDDDTLIMRPAVENAEYEVQITYQNDGVAETIEYVDDDGETFVKIVLIEETTIPGYDVILISALILIGGIMSLIFWRKKLTFNF